MEDLKVFIDVNVETVTNSELLLDNKICHASSTTYRLLLCIACITLYWTSFFSHIFASGNITKTRGLYCWKYYTPDENQTLNKK